MTYTEDDVTNNMGLVFMIAKRMKHLTKGATTDFEDLISDGVLGLIHALDRFEPDRGLKFSSYAYRCISGYMFRGHRKVNQEIWKALQSKFDVPCNTIPMFYPELNLGEVREVLGMDDRGKACRTILNTIDNRSVWKHLMPLLSPRQRQMMQMSLEGMNQPQIAVKLGVTRQCVSQTMLRAITKAKKIFDVKEAA
jgi:RNA polymerase sporulation-specific sigma factor